MSPWDTVIEQSNLYYWYSEELRKEHVLHMQEWFDHMDLCDGCDWCEISDDDE